jgi:hypothetical protein
MNTEGKVHRVVVWIGCVVLGLVLFVLGWREWKGGQIERYGMAELARCRSMEELEASVKPLGIVISRSDGTWIAIWYRESHVWPWWSRAVGLTSRGEWFVSKRNFCGSFQAVRILQYYGKSIEMTDVHRIAIAPSLESALGVLQSMGFRGTEGPKAALASGRP